eukprot:TRINITY_DN860_c1_g1_i1.p1 TRINITY_DN860_c1_g1~~TRINITY_DN860_c1_g1_i1.p1  ORF type:complete len:366 (-),score=55.74 TRINITY_DN860_c1_g1_i1:60-1157(-)
MSPLRLLAFLFAVGGDACVAGSDSHCRGQSDDDNNYEISFSLLQSNLHRDQPDADAVHADQVKSVRFYDQVTEGSEGLRHRMQHKEQKQEVQGMHKMTEEKLTQSAQTNAAGQGILLWSEGRSASGSFMFTLQQTTGFEFCNENKESFNVKDSTLSFESLERCIQKGQLLAHVKPEHLTRSKSVLRTPEAFMDAAFRAGFKMLITNFRENQLARDVSSFELAASHEGYDREELALERIRYTSAVQAYEKDRRIFNDGINAATKAGFTLVPMSFSAVTASTCTCALKAMVLYSGRSDLNCVAEVQHDVTSHREASLEERTTKKAASGIRDALSNTSYAWMLDLTAEDWPSEIRPPLPVPTWHQSVC